MRDRLKSLLFKRTQKNKARIPCRLQISWVLIQNIAWNNMYCHIYKNNDHRVIYVSYNKQGQYCM